MKLSHSLTCEQEGSNAATPLLHHREGLAHRGGWPPQGTLGNAGPQGHFQLSSNPGVRSKSPPGKGLGPAFSRVLQAELTQLK